MPTLLWFFYRTYFYQRWIAAMDPQQVEVEASVVIPTDICLLLVRAFMHYAAGSTFRYHVHSCLLVITGISICIFCALATCRNLWFLSGVILIPSYWLLMLWDEWITSVLSLSSWLSSNLTSHFQTGCSVSEKLVDKLIKTHQNIYWSLKCHLNLLEISVATIMRVFRYSGIYLIRSRVIRGTV